MTYLLIFIFIYGQGKYFINKYYPNDTLKETVLNNKLSTKKGLKNLKHNPSDKNYLGDLQF